MSVSEVQSWPSSVLVEWQAHLELLHEARTEQADDAAVEEKLKKVLKPRN